MNIEYYMKLQNAYNTKNNREKKLVQVNRNAEKHFKDTFDTQDVLVNNKPMELMIIKDTDKNTYKKKIKSKKEDKFNIGDYVKWNDQIWMVTLVDSDEKVWNCGYMYLCTAILRWQDIDSGEIIERWVYAEDYTKYSMGEFGNNNVTVGDYQYGMTIPVDNYTRKLHRGNRFVIDFEGNYPPDTYRLAGKKAFISDYRYFNRGGVMVITLSYNFFNSEKDKQVVLPSGEKVWICDYVDMSQIQEQPILPPSQNNLKANIVGNDKIKINLGRTYYVEFVDTDNKPVEPIFTWNIKSNFKVKQERIDNKIKLTVDNNKNIHSSFTLQVVVNDLVIAEKEITVVDII